MDGKSLIVILIMVSASASAEVYKCADGKYQLTRATTKANR